MRKALRIAAIVVTSLLLLVMLVMVWFTTDSGKNFIRVKTIAFLEKKLKTEVHIGKLDYHIPDMVELTDVYFKDQNKDTILAAARLRTDISMLKLLSDKVEINNIEIEGALVHLYRIAPDTAFNFDYIVKAFAAPPDPQKQDAPTDSTGQLQLDLKKLMLHKVYVRYDDYTGGDRFAINIDTLNSSVKKVDPYSQQYALDTLYIDGLSANFSMDTSYLLPKKPDSAKVQRLPYFEANELNLQNIAFKFSNNNDQLYFNLNIGKLFTHPKSIDLSKQIIAVKNLEIDTSAIVLAMGKKSAQQAKDIVQTNPVPAKKWYIYADTIKLNEVSYKMDMEYQPKLAYGMDYSHMDIRHAVLDAVNARYTTDTISGNIRHLAARDKSGVDVKDLRAVFLYQPKGVSLTNLHIETSRSIINDDISISYPDVKMLAASPQVLSIQADIKNSVAGVEDVLLFAPQLRKLPVFTKYRNDRVRLTASVKGPLNNLDIPAFKLQGFGNSYVDASGKITGLPDPNRLSYNFNIVKLQSNKTVAESFLPPATLKTIDLPNTFSIAGKVSGTTSSVNTDLVANTSDGSVTIKGPLSFGVRPGSEKYDLYIKANKLNIGKLIRQQTNIGTITGTISAKGQSLDINYMNAVINGDIQSATILGYTYTGVNFKAKVANKNAEVHLESKDPNAQLTFDGTASFKNKYPAIVGRLAVANADLQALKLSTTPFSFAGTVDADIPVLDPDYPKGSVIINRPIITLDGQRYVLDSLYITASPSADSGNYIVVHTGDIEAVISGHTPLTQIGDIVQSHINRHYAINIKDSLKALKTVPASYDLYMNAFVKDGPATRMLLPGLKLADTARVVAGLTPNTMYLNASAPAFSYNDISVFNGKADLKGDNTALNYNITADRITNGNMDLKYLAATGSVLQQSITSKISVSDDEKRQRFAIDFVYHQHPDRQEVHINDGMILNYRLWQVTQPNSIVFSKDGFYVQNFRISHENESISFNSTAQQYTAPLTVAINNFLISNITEIMSSDTLLANGIVNGSITLQDMMKQPKINGNLAVNNLMVKGDTIGDVNAQIASATANEANARITINGRGNDIAVSGYYYPKAVNGNNFDLDVHINTLNVHTVEGLAMYQIKNSTGNVHGDLKIKGTVANPIVNGNLHTDNLTTTIAALGARFTMPAESLEFTPAGVEFKNFKLVDETGNAALVDGTVNTTNMNNMGLDLRVHANRFMVLNTTAKDNKLFYGKLFVSTNLNVKGTVMAPEVNGNLTVHDSTRLTVVVPEQEITFQDREGIVEFVSKRDTGRYVLTTPTDTIPRLAFRAGSYMNVNLTVQKDAEFNVIIDQGTGDFIRMKGEANLNTVINPDGTVGLAGVYTLNEGSYQLNYNFIKRKFNIESGSTVTFAGDPLEAQIDIKAVYEAMVPPYELVEKQVTDPAQLVYYRQRLPFQVVLTLKGDLMKPDIGFNIALPEDRNYGVSSGVSSLVDAKLNDLRNNPSEMNKQVFSLLLLNRFVSDNPFESSAGADVAYVARQSVTRFIGEQLNSFAGELIQGIDLTLDLQATEDYTTGQRRSRTDLSVNASKRLLNDRLTITLGNNFELQGQNNNRNAGNTVLPTNIAADYELTPTGKYKVRVYRRTENDDLVRSYVSETGASFILDADYNRFRNLFINRRKKLKKMRQEQQQEQKPQPNTTARN